MSSGDVLGRAVLELDADDSKLNQKLDGAETKASGVGDKLTGIGSKLSLGVTAPLLLFGTASFNAASDAAESMSKVNVVFGDSADAIKTFTSTAAENLGVSEGAANDAAGTFGNLFTTMGLGEADAAKMTEQILTLGSDLGSFNNMDPTEALDKLRAGLVGEAEPLRSMGVNLTAAAVEAKAMEMGLADANGEVTDAGLVQARMALILEQTSKAQGDFARTSDGAANSTRIAKAQMADASAELGTNLLPVITKVINFVGMLAEKFGNLPGSVQTIIVVIGVLLAALGPIMTVVGAIIGILPILGTVFAAVGAIIAGPFLLPILAIVGVIALVAALFLAWKTNFLGIQDITASVIAFLVGAFNTVLSVATTVWGAISGVITTAFDSVLGVVTTVWGAVSTVITAAVDVIQLSITNWINNFTTLWNGVWGLLQGPVTTAFDAIKLVIETVFGVLETVITTYLGIYQTIFETVFPILQTVAETAINAVKAIFETVFPILQTIAETAINAVQAVFDLVFPIIETVVTTYLGIIQGIFETVFPVIQAVVETVFTIIKELIEATLGTIIAIITGDLDSIKGIWADAWQAVSDKVSELWDVIKTTVTTAISDVLGFFDGLVTDATAKAQAVYDGVKGFFDDLKTDVVQAVSDMVSDAVDAIGDLPGEAVSALGDLSSTLYQKGVDLVQGFIDGVSDMLGKLRDKIGEIGGIVSDIDVPGFSPIDVAGKHMGRMFTENMGQGLSQGTGAYVAPALATIGAAHATLPSAGLDAMLSNGASNQGLTGGEIQAEIRTAFQENGPAMLALRKAVERGIKQAGAGAT